MKRAIKLVLYWGIYNVICSSLLILFQHYFPTFVTANHITSISITNILPNLFILWHIIHFNYVKFNQESFTEVPSKTIWLSLPFIIAGMLFFNLCNEFLELPNQLEDLFLGMSRNVFGIFSIVIMAPLVEELLFRSAIEGHLLKQGKNPVIAILISSHMFGIVHLNPAQIPFAFAIGMIFGWLYYRTGSVVPGIVGHFINNSIACLQMAVSTKEELNTKTIDLIGEVPTYLLFAASLAVTFGMFLYLKKRLPEAPDYTSPSCHLEQSEHVLLSEIENSVNINEVNK